MASGATHTAPAKRGRANPRRRRPARHVAADRDSSAHNAVTAVAPPPCPCSTSHHLSTFLPRDAIVFSQCVRGQISSTIAFVTNYLFNPDFGFIVSNILRLSCVRVDVIIIPFFSSLCTRTSFIYLLSCIKTFTGTIQSYRRTLCTNVKFYLR